MSTKNKKQQEDLIPCMNPTVKTFKTFYGDPFINAETIYWHLEGALTTDFEGVKVIEAFRGAFTILQPYFHPIRFESTSDINQANIIMHFAVNGDTDLPIPFDPNVLAYAFSPSRNKSHVWFNDEMNWGDMHRQNQTYSLETVAVHEFLHSLGLSHSNTEQWPGDILNPFYSPNYKITQDTIDGINFLYGKLKAAIAERDKPVDPPVEEEPKPPVVDEEVIKELKEKIGELQNRLNTIQAGYILEVRKKVENNARVLKLMEDMMDGLASEVYSLRKRIDAL